MATAQQITVHGKPLTLVGKLPQPGDRLPEFELTGPGHKPVKTGAFDGKVRIIATVPCLSTSVCDAMTRKFNEAASKLGNDVTILTLSMDLPQTQEQWCGAAGIKGMQVLSDHKDAQFGKGMGVLIKEWRELARAVFVVDRDGVIRYVHLVNEVADEPNYKQILDEAKGLVEAKASSRM
jgi:thiol peroxidase